MTTNAFNKCIQLKPPLANTYLHLHEKQLPFWLINWMICDYTTRVPNSWLLLGVEDTVHVTKKTASQTHCFPSSFIPYCLTSIVSSPPSKSQTLGAFYININLRKEILYSTDKVKLQAYYFLPCQIDNL